MTLLELIREALNNAREGGHGDSIDKMTDEQLVDDLRDYDADVAPYSHAQVLDAVAQIRGARV